MPNSNSFDRLIQKALETQDLPPLPNSILNAWLAPVSESSAKWLWILPSVIFVVGIAVGVELAPLGLTNAFSSMKGVLSNAWQSITGDAMKWASALFLVAIILALDSLRNIHSRLK